MESSRSPKNVLVLKETDRTELIKSNTIRKSIYIPIEYNSSAGKRNKNLPNKENSLKIWCSGNIKIPSGKEKDEGAKIYLIMKEVGKAV